jgi:hypothetical protein
MVNRLVVVKDESFHLRVSFCEPILRHVVDSATIQKNKSPCRSEGFGLEDALLHFTKARDGKNPELEIFLI